MFLQERLVRVGSMYRVAQRPLKASDACRSDGTMHAPQEAHEGQRCAMITDWSMAAYDRGSDSHGVSVKGRKRGEIDGSFRKALLVAPNVASI